MSSSTLVAVTGANGFLGAHVVDQLLQANIKTRAIVRSEKSASGLQTKYAKEVNEGLLEFAYVADISTHGPVYNEAFKGATGLIHVASPIFQVGQESENREDRFLKPAIFGALNALEAAHRTPTIQKVVMTSSVTSATPPGRAGEILSDYYPPITYEEAVKLPADRDTYGASKTLAEKAAWKYFEEKKPQYTFTTLLVGLILGSNATTGKSDPTGSNEIYLAMAKYPQGFVSFPTITVQDAASAHIQSLLHRRRQTDGKRILVVEKILFAKEAVELAKANAPHFPAGSAPSSFPKKGEFLDVNPESDAKLLSLSFSNTDAEFVKLVKEAAEGK